MKLAIYGRLTDKTDAKVLHEFFSFLRAQRIGYLVHAPYALELEPKLDSWRELVAPHILDDAMQLKGFDFAQCSGRAQLDHRGRPHPSQHQESGDHRGHLPQEHRDDECAGEWTGTELLHQRDGLPHEDDSQNHTEKTHNVQEPHSTSVDFAQNLGSHHLRIVPMTPSRRRQRDEDEGSQTGQAAPLPNQGAQQPQPFLGTLGGTDVSERGWARLHMRREGDQRLAGCGSRSMSGTAAAMSRDIRSKVTSSDPGSLSEKKEI